jgi:hypothetical protein
MITEPTCIDAEASIAAVSLKILIMLTQLLFKKFKVSLGGSADTRKMT